MADLLLRLRYFMVNFLKTSFVNIHVYYMNYKALLLSGLFFFSNFTHPMDFFHKNNRFIFSVFMGSIFLYVATKYGKPFISEIIVKISSLRVFKTSKDKALRDFLKKYEND